MPIGHRNTETVKSPTAMGTVSVVFGLGRWFSNRLWKEASRKLMAQWNLRHELEIGNFCSSHCCTSDVRLWSGARLVLAHQRVPLCHLVVPVPLVLRPWPSR